MDFSLGAEAGLEFDLDQMQTGTQNRENTSKEVSMNRPKNTNNHLFLIENFNSSPTFEWHVKNHRGPFPLLPFSNRARLFPQAVGGLPAPELRRKPFMKTETQIEHPAPA
jgi:hypothetical protein